MSTLHLAGALDATTLTQCCDRCGAVLVGPELRETDIWAWDRAKGHEVRVGTRVVAHERLFPRYQSGDVVEVTPFAQCIVLTPEQPNCLERGALIRRTA